MGVKFQNQHKTSYFLQHLLSNIDQQANVLRCIFRSEIGHPEPSMTLNGVDLYCVSQFYSRIKALGSVVWAYIRRVPNSPHRNSETKENVRE